MLVCSILKTILITTGSIFAKKKNYDRGSRPLDAQEQQEQWSCAPVTGCQRVALLWCDLILSCFCSFVSTLPATTRTAYFGRRQMFVGRTHVLLALLWLQRLRVQTTQIHSARWVNHTYHHLTYTFVLASCKRIDPEIVRWTLEA
jgi:ABC-type maltose transport system permease subunit